MKRPRFSIPENIMLGQVPETPYDLHFRMLGIPVRIHPGFFIIAAAISWIPGSLGLVGVGMVCIFISILIHELGHALTAQSCGWPPHIVLHWFGGYAQYNPGHGYTRGKQLGIVLAGPGAGLMLYGLCYAFDQYVRIKNPGLYDNFYFYYSVLFLMRINLYWSLLNLIPVFPLDGGQAARQILETVNPGRGLIWTLQLGIVSGVLVALAFGYMHQRGYGSQPFVIIMFLLLAFNNYQMLQQFSGRGGGYY